MPKERIQKLIAAAGLMSRRKAEEAILAGRVSLNGAVTRELGTQADLATDRLEVDGSPIGVKTDRKTYVFYKPRGCVTTKSDDRGRRTVMDYFTDDTALNPVGRLDFESEGLLLMTHDGDLLLKLTHPRYGFQKKYEVTLTGEWKPQFASKLTSGVMLDDGMGRFDGIVPVNESLNESGIAPTFLVTVSEGRNRFIRRMFTVLGLGVTRLKRVQMGPVLLGDLKPGEKRELTSDELQTIQSPAAEARLGEEK